jgi:3-oxoadipate enol-lactonase
MPFAIGAGKARIHYETSGTEGPWVVLIQGLGLSSRFWFDVPDALARGPDPWRVVTVDNRGVGESDRPHWPPYSMASMADDVAAVLDHAGIPRAYVVGISLGGMIAQHVALRHPGRVAGLVLIATSAGLPHMRMPRVRDLVTFMALPFNGGLQPREAVDDAFARLLLSRKDFELARQLLAGWPEALRTRPTPLRVFMAHFASILGHSTGRHLGRVACPVVILAGDDDSLLPLDNARALARLMPGSHLEVVPGGHILHAADPDCVRRALDRTRADARDRFGELEGSGTAAPLDHD